MKIYLASKFLTFYYEILRQKNNYLGVELGCFLILLFIGSVEKFNAMETRIEVGKHSLGILRFPKKNLLNFNYEKCIEFAKMIMDAKVDSRCCLNRRLPK